MGNNKHTFDRSYRDHYTRHGYVCVPSVPPQILENAEMIVDRWIGTVIREWLDGGLIKHDYAEVSRDQRFIQAWIDAGKPAYNRDSVHYLINSQMYELLTQDYFLDLAECLLDTSELSASGVQNIRLKHPQLPWSVVPWHADLYYWKEYQSGEPLKFIIMWLPIQDVDADTGAIQVVSLEQASGLDYPVENGKVFLPEEAVQNFVPQTLTMKRGEVLCMCDTVIHRSVPNMKPSTMWNVDVRYEVTNSSGEITDQFGFVARSSHPERITPMSEWLKKQAPKREISYSNK